jgi:hypothetical protein
MFSTFGRLAAVLFLVKAGIQSYCYEKFEPQPDESSSITTDNSFFARVYNAEDGVTLCEADIDENFSENNLPCDVDTSIYSLSLGENRIMVDVYFGYTGEVVSTFQVATLLNTDYSFIDGYDTQSYGKVDFFPFVKQVLRTSMATCTVGALVHASSESFRQSFNISFGFNSSNDKFDHGGGGKKRFSLFRMLGIQERSRSQASESDVAALVADLRPPEDSCLAPGAADEGASSEIAILEDGKRDFNESSAFSSDSSVMDAYAAKSILMSRIRSIMNSGVQSSAVASPLMQTSAAENYNENRADKSAAGMFHRRLLSIRKIRIPRAVKTAASMVIFAAAALKLGPTTVDTGILTTT